MDRTGGPDRWTGTGTGTGPVPVPVAMSHANLFLPLSFAPTYTSLMHTYHVADFVVAYSTCA